MHIVRIRKTGTGLRVGHTGRMMKNKMSGHGQSSETYAPENHEEVRGKIDSALPKSRSLGGGLAIRKPKEKKYVSLNL